jgi:hypothetical protein
VLEKVEKADQDSWLQGIYRNGIMEKAKRERLRKHGIKDNTYGMYVSDNVSVYQLALCYVFERPPGSPLGWEVAIRARNVHGYILSHCKSGTRGSLVVKALGYKPEGRGFETR